MPHDLYVTIKSNYNTFTRTERNIANYVLKSPKEVLYMTITELASACKVGDTSVFRFCRHLGKNGYQDFKVDLAQSVSDAQAVPDLSRCIVSNADTSDVMIRKVLNNNIAVLMETYQLIVPATLSAAIRWFTEARHIYFFGVGASSTSAMEAHNRFLRVCSKAEYVPDAYLQMMQASLMTPDDVAILFSYSGTTRETLSIAQAAKATGAHTICISRYAHSPLAELCDLLFLCGGNEGPLQSGNLSVKSAQLFLMEVLYIAYCQANPDDCNRSARFGSVMFNHDKC